MSSVSQRMKVRPPVIADNHRFAVNQKRCGVDAKGGIYDGREAVGPVMTVTREAPDPNALTVAGLADRRARVTGGRALTLSVIVFVPVVSR